MLKLVKNFPVPAIGVVASVLLAVAQALQDSPSWEAAVPAVAAALAALFVTPSYRVSSSNYVLRPSREDGYVSWTTVVVAVLVVIVLLFVLPQV